MEELKTLIHRSQGGDLDAFGTIVKRFQDMAIGYAYSILDDFHLAEDAAQEAFIEAYRCLPKLRELDAFSSWFRKIVFKHCDRLTRRRRIETIPLEEVTEVPSSQKGPPEIAEEKEMKADVLRAIAELPEKERMVTTLFYINGYSWEEIGEFLGVTTRTVKNQLYSARNRLRKRLMTMVADDLQTKRPSRNNQFALTVQLFTAVEMGKLAKIKELLSIAPDLVNVKNSSGQTLLHIAAYYGYKEVMELLLSRGIAVDARDYSGRTPLHHMVLGCNQPDVAQLLLNHGAVIHTTDNQSTTPVSLAANHNRYNLSHSLTLLPHQTEPGESVNIIAKSPAPLSLIAIGTEEIIGRPVYPEHPKIRPIAHFVNFFGEEHHLFDLFTTPDFVYIVGVVLSAFAIFLSFDAICGEKETHTLSLLLSYPLPRSTLLFAKWVGGYVSFLISLSPALLLMLIYLTAFSGVPLETGHWVRLILIICLSLVYLSACFTLGLFVSTLTHRSATSLILVLFIWTIWILGAPRVGVSAARVIKQVPTEMSFRKKKDLVIPNWELTSDEREKIWQMNDAYIAKVDGQIEMGQHLSRLSPWASYLYASTTLAQTGPSDMADYRRQLSKWLRMYQRSGEEPTGFVYHPLSLKNSLSFVLIDGVLLMMWNILLFMGAFTAFLRYDVR